MSNPDQSQGHETEDDAPRFEVNCKGCNTVGILVLVSGETPSAVINPTLSEESSPGGECE